MKIRNEVTRYKWESNRGIGGTTTKYYDTGEVEEVSGFYPFSIVQITPPDPEIRKIATSRQG